MRCSKLCGIVYNEAIAKKNLGGKKTETKTTNKSND